MRIGILAGHNHELGGSRIPRALWVILAAGFLLRVATVFWGTPVLPFSHSFHPDEAKAYEMTAGFPGVYFSDARFLQYGTAYSYTLGVLVFPLKAILVYGAGWYETYHDVVWVFCRFASVFLGTATVYLQFRYVSRYLDERAALLSALFLSTAFYPALNSAVATLDVPLSFFLLLNLLILTRLVEKPNHLTAIGLGIATTYLVGTKLLGVPFLVVPLGLVLLGRIPPKIMGTYVLTAAILFLAFHPHILTRTAVYLTTFRSEQFNWNERLAGSLGQSFRSWGSTTSVAMGLPLALLAAGGALFWKARPRAEKRLLIAAIVLSYALWPGFFPARFVIAFAPLLCLLAAGFLHQLLVARHRAFPLVAWGIAGITLVVSLYSCAVGIWVRWNDPRPQAARFLSQTIPLGATVGFSITSERYPWRHHAWRYPALDLSRHSELPIWEEPDYLITSAMDLNPIEKALRSPALLPDYSWDPAHDRDWYMYSPPSPRLFRFYQRLFDREGTPYEIIRSFSIHVSVPVEFPPREIRVYRKRHPVTHGEASSSHFDGS